FGSKKELPKPQFTCDGNYVLTRIEGVTVAIGRKGGLKVPAVRTYANGSDKYETEFDAVLNADKCWTTQKARLLKKPDFDLKNHKGHANPIVDTDWKCEGNKTCPCRSENLQERMRRADA